MHWHYRNLTFLLVSFLFAYAFGQTYLYNALLNNLVNVGPVGIVVVGAFFISIFTVAPAAVVLVGLGQHYDILAVAVLAGLGGTLGDLLIFHFIREGVLGELRELIGAKNLHKFLHPFRSRYFHWLLPLLGAIIIASPLPDEAGVTLMGISKIKQWFFVPLSFMLNSMGIYLLLRATS